MELATRLAPLLLARLEELAACARAVAGGQWADLDGLEREVHDLGWGLGCLARARGTDLLLARRHPRAVRTLVGLACARGAIPTIDPGPEHLFEASTRVGQGWELACAATLAFLRCTAGEVKWSFAVEQDTALLCLEESLGTGFDELLPGARALPGVGLAFSARWLASD
jgi:hypothetical protein